MSESKFLAKAGQKVCEGASAGIVGIGVGTALEGVGLAAVGSSITGSGCAAVVAAAHAAEVIPVAGSLVSTGLGSLSTGVFLACSNPIVAPIVATGAVGYAAYRFIKWLAD